MNNDLLAFVDNLTQEPGVYRMLDALGHVLYVGKAKNLKKRVASYFTKQVVAVKTRSLVSQICAIDVSVTRTETEALLLESNLIKLLRPKYNILLRDDKTYPFIHISTEQTYPRIEVVRYKKKPKKGSFYGPYPSANATRDALATIQKIFKLRNCSDNFFNGRSRPCLQYQIQRCTAPCTDHISPVDYRHAVDDVILFLTGRKQVILDRLAQRMEHAVAGLNFEAAAILRDEIKQLRLIQEQQSITQHQGEADVIVTRVDLSFAVLHCVSIREGEVIASKSFFPALPAMFLTNDEDYEQTRYQQVIMAFIRFYYLDTPERIPNLLIFDQPLADQAILAELLSSSRNKKCKIQTKPSIKTRRWIEFAHDNLQRAVDEHYASKITMTERYLALNVLLNVAQPIQRMECFDISHIQGHLTVASCVVFDQQGPSKKNYKRFNISGITPGDDYAAMKQVLTRRFSHQVSATQASSWDYPDLLIIDGGKGQLKIAQEVLATLNIENITVIGIVKGLGRKAEFDRIIDAKNYTEIILSSHSKALHLIQHIRNEAHRFAITAHRKKREKSALSSSIETLAGVGPKRRKALLQRFGGVRELSQASTEEIAKVSGISKMLAQTIFEHFH